MNYTDMVFCSVLSALGILYICEMLVRLLLSKELRNSVCVFFSDSDTQDEEILRLLRLAVPIEKLTVIKKSDSANISEQINLIVRMLEKEDKK